jgi:4'-phosphopantetheinyl transferase
MYKKLSADSCDVWLCSLSGLKNKESVYLTLLCAEERSRAERFKFTIHRERFIASHGFTRIVLGNYLNAPPECIVLQKGRYGKPFLNPDKGCISHSLQFNLSHTEDLALLAVTQKHEIGVDIECTDRKTDWQGIVQRFFTKSEQKQLFLLDDKEQQKKAFFELWTRKEAYMKVLGTGLSLAPTDFTLSVPPQKPRLIAHYSNKHPELAHVTFKSITMPEQYSHYSASLAIASQQCDYQLHQFS